MFLPSTFKEGAVKRELNAHCASHFCSW